MPDWVVRALRTAQAAVAALALALPADPPSDPIEALTTAGIVAAWARDRELGRRGAQVTTDPGLLQRHWWPDFQACSQEFPCPFLRRLFRDVYL